MDVTFTSEGVLASLANRSASLVSTSSFSPSATRHTLKPGEVPPLELGLCNFEVLGGVFALLALLRNREGELLVWKQAIGLRPVDGRVDLETDVEELASKEVGPKPLRKLPTPLLDDWTGNWLTGQAGTHNLKLR